ncbi:MAG: hypothetical protein B7Z79_12485 [Thiomonas sp. 20-64-9]|nr:MAG: hypothetical protein B7Z79_12485 [Thiomonas sp. 20-64-9]
MDMIGKIRRLHFSIADAMEQKAAGAGRRSAILQPAILKSDRFLGSKPAHQKPTLSKNRRLIAIRLPSSRPQTPGQN